MTIRFMVEAQEQMQERKMELDASIDKLEQDLKDARAESEALQRYMEEQQEAIDRAANPKPKRRSRGKGSRPTTRRPPAEGTKTRAVFDFINGYDGLATIGVICTRTNLTPNSVKSIVADLHERELIERVGEGSYQRKPQA